MSDQDSQSTLNERLKQYGTYERLGPGPEFDPEDTAKIVAGIKALEGDKHAEGSYEILAKALELQRNEREQLALDLQRSQASLEEQRLRMRALRVQIEALRRIMVSPAYGTEAFCQTFLTWAQREGVVSWQGSEADIQEAMNRLKDPPAAAHSVALGSLRHRPESQEGNGLPEVTNYGPGGNRLLMETQRDRDRYKHQYERAQVGIKRAIYEITEQSGHVAVVLKILQGVAADDVADGMDEVAILQTQIADQQRLIDALNERCNFLEKANAEEQLCASRAEQAGQSGFQRCRDLSERLDTYRQAGQPGLVAD